MPSFGLAHPRARFRFDRLTPAGLARLARFPSYRAPRAADLHDPTTFRPPVGPADADEMTGRDFLTRGTTRDSLRLVAVQPFMAELAACPHLATLRRLDLTGNRVGPAGARALAGSPHLGGLRALGLNGNALGPEGAGALAGAPGLAGLERLELAENGLGADALAGLLMSLPHLTRLDVSRNPVGLGLWLARPGLREVTAVGVIDPRTGTRGLSHPPAGTLEAIDLRHNPLGPADLATLRAGAPALGRLDLGFTDCAAGGPIALAGPYPALHTLSLKATRLTPAAVPTRSVPAVEALDLSVNPLGDAGVAAALAAFPNATSVDLSNADVCDAGLRRLVASGGLARVRSLRLAWNRVSDPLPLLDLPCLDALDLTGCPVGRRAAVALAARFGTIRG